MTESRPIGRRRQGSPVYERACTNCGTPYKTTLPRDFFTKNSEKDRCLPCTQDRQRTTTRPHV